MSASVSYFRASVLDRKRSGMALKSHRVSHSCKPFVMLSLLKLLWIGSALWLANVNAQDDIEWFWADLPRLDPISARELARARKFIGYMGNTAFSHSGEVDLRDARAYIPPNIDIRDQNLKTAIIESKENDDEAANRFVINDFVDKHIERVQVNSILLAQWEVKTDYETTQYKLHSLGCSLWVAWLRWSEAWNIDHRDEQCKIFVLRDAGTTEENAQIQSTNTTTEGDSDGFVNTEYACIQSRTLNNFELVRELQSNKGNLKISRYNVGGQNRFHIDLESFYEDIRDWEVRFDEVRYTSFYTASSDSWNYNGHLSFPPQNGTEFSSGLVAESRYRRQKQCARQLIRDRRRVRSKAIDDAIAKGQEALLDSNIVLPPQTDVITILTAAVSSVVAAVSTTSRIGTFVLGKLEERGYSHSTNVRVALCIEFVAQLAFAVPLHLVVANEAQRLRSDTVQSIVYITTTEYEDAPGLTYMTSRSDADSYHLFNMVQASRKANPPMLILGVTLEFAFLVFAVVFVLFQRRRCMNTIQKSPREIETA